MVFRGLGVFFAHRDRWRPSRLSRCKNTEVARDVAMLSHRAPSSPDSKKQMHPPPTPLTLLAVSHVPPWCASLWSAWRPWVASAPACCVWSSLGSSHTRRRVSPARDVAAALEEPFDPARPLPWAISHASRALPGMDDDDRSARRATAKARSRRSELTQRQFWRMRRRSSRASRSRVTSLAERRPAPSPLTEPPPPPPSSGPS